MRKYIPAIALLLFVSLGSCKKDKEETFTTFPPPSWEKDNTGQYPLSMTAVVQLPYQLQTELQPGDELAAFIKGECRGVGEPVEVGNAQVFFVLIQGSTSEQGSVVFKYYSTKSAYIYTSANSPEFEVDGNYGTADAPVILDLQPTK